ncbi:hypothetical protein [Halomonas campaniensis]|uniref:hypothetical protein n=1 Tax=Halomonas campaniensis TaxID=213554 RepID=UPI0011304278|nr:hypothetical protein [Halomonas campaniensis]
MDRAGDDAADSMTNMQRRLAGVERFATVAGGAIMGLSAGAGVFTAIAHSASQSAAEIDNLSRLANTNVEDFQRLSFASRAYGVEQDKLADILKDTNDRVGDFLSTGGGEMKDFFEQIAPQIGVTAEEFRNLSGPQALQKYYDGLQAANLSQAEMTFYMESVADEATALIPLLRDGGAEMRRLGQEADDLSAILSQMEIQRLKDIRGEFGQLGQQLSTETMRAVSQFDDLMKSSLEGISYGINNVARGFNVFMDSFRDGEAKRSIAGIDAELNALFDTKARLEQRIDMFGADAPQAQDSIVALGELRGEYTALIDRKKELQQAGLPVTEPEIVQLDRAVISADELAKAQKDAQKEADLFSDSLQSIQDRLFPLEASQRSYRDDQELLTMAWAKGEMGVMRYLEALNRLQQAQMSTQTAADAYGGGGGFGSEIGSRGGVGAPTDPMADVVGNQGQDYWGKWLESAETAFTDFDQMAANTAESFQQGFGTAFERMVFDSQTAREAAQNLFEGMGRTAINTLGQMAGQWAAYHGVQLALGKSTEATAIGSAIATGSSIAAAYAPAAAAASLASFGANSVPAMAGMSSAYGLSSTLALTGMAHDGIDRIPREGTWLLDKGERVLNAPQADRLDNYIAREERGGEGGGAGPINVDVQVINNGKPQQASAAVEQRNQRDFIVKVMLNDLNSGSSRSYTEQLASTFGMSRRGR